MFELNNGFYLISYYDYFDKLLRLENVVIFKTIQDSFHSCHRNLENIVSIIVLNIETRHYNIKINLAISYSPKSLANARGNYWGRERELDCSTREMRRRAHKTYTIERHKTSR